MHEILFTEVDIDMTVVWKLWGYIHSVLYLQFKVQKIPVGVEFNPMAI